MNSRHPKWIAYLQEFTFSLKHKSSTQNKVVDALSKRMNLLATLHVRVVGFIVFPEMYQNDPDFGQICSKGV